MLSKTDKIFKGLQAFDSPTEELLESCFNLAYDDDSDMLIIPEVLVKLIEWIPDINEREQTFLSALIVKGCTSNYAA